MAYQIQLSGVPLPVEPRKTDPLIQCIIDNKFERFCKLIRRKDINGLYPYEDWKDDVTLLTAAVICKNEKICSYLIKESADTNKLSTNRFAPLHYAGRTPGISLSIVKRLLAAKADPDGCDLQLSPLQFAVDHNLDDIVKALLEAGAKPSINYGGNPELDKKMDDIIHELSSQNEDFEKVQIFFSFSCAVPKKHQTEVFSIYRAHFLKENPFIHTLLFEEYFSVFGAEQYQQSAIKWLKDTKSADKYIEDVIKRFPRIRMRYLAIAFNCLNAVLRVSERLSPQIFNDLVPILTNSVQPLGNVHGDRVNQLILIILDVMMQKNQKQKLNISNSVYETVCNALMPLTKANSIQISLSTYGVFAQMNDFAPEVVAKCGLSPVPERILNAAVMKLDEPMKEKLQKLNTSLEDPSSLSAAGSVCEENRVATPTRRKKKKKKKKNQQALESQVGEKEDEEKQSFPETKTSTEETNSSVQAFTPPVENPPGARSWYSISHRWKELLEILSIIDANKTSKIKNLTLVVSDDFKIAQGSDGTEVFLGLRDDGTEVAVKRMNRSNYRVLKNELECLRRPELYDPSIVGYIDFAEDDNFGYLMLQLCEYTLEEFIQDHLPADESSERTCVLKELVRNVLCSLQVLHSPKTNVLHRDIKPNNVLIDISGKAKLSDFGISRRLKQSETTLRTSTAGTKCWKAKETIDVKSNRGYKKSSDIQVAGMLVYYILSRGHHPFGEDPYCEVNILEGKYTLEHLKDDVAKDLVEWMINKDPGKRPTVEQTLAHPFFWNDERKVEYLKTLGNQNEAENCRNADEELLRAIEKYSERKTFSEWKTKFPLELVQKLDGKKKYYPENTLGLLRFIRNLYQHYLEDTANINIMTSFPDLFGSMYMFGKERKWHSRFDFSFLNIESVPVI